jgi:hypothetical protein
LYSWLPPLSEDSLIHYATHCHKHLNLKYSTIKLYICGIRYKFLQFEIPNLFSNCCSSKMFRLEAIYKGIKKSEVKNTSHTYRSKKNQLIIKIVCMNWSHTHTAWESPLLAIYPWFVELSYLIPNYFAVLFTGAASNFGFGGYFQRKWFSSEWPLEIASSLESNLSMAFRTYANLLYILSIKLWSDAIYRPW